VVAESLDELDGPAQGELVLPSRLDWGPERTYRLDRPSDVRLMYERVLREALRVDDLRAYLNRGLLIAVWADLFLPPQVRALWERRFGALFGARSA
jgi:hypothetical protein